MGKLLRQPGIRLRPLQVVVHIAAWIPLAVLIYDFLTDNLSANPIQAAEIRTGDIALILLILSLACTPANLLFRQHQVIRARRALGLYGYMYAAIHLLIFTGLDYAFDPQQLIEAFTQKWFIIAGLIAFLILSLLAVTSFRWWKAHLGKNWKRLHQLVYAANLMVVLHFAWSLKGDLLRLQGSISRPVLAGVVIVILLIFRIPTIRRAVAGQKRRDISSPVIASPGYQEGDTKGP